MIHFPNLEEIIFQIVEQLKNNGKITADDLKEIKRQYAKKYRLDKLPTNIQLLKTYQQMINSGQALSDQRIFSLLKKRGIRSQSGIVPVQVLMMPWYCPGECIFCPNDPSMPKSYINTEPGAMRALLNQFDPIKQVWNRLLSLTLTGHPIDKIEMIVLGGTFDAYPKDYKISFIKGLYDACNTFQKFLSQVEVKDLNPKAARFTIDYDKLDIKFSDSLQEAQKINETAASRIVGLTIETRPEFVTDQNARFWRQLGVTRIEMGVQSLFDDVLEANKRGHTVKDIQKAFHKLRQYGFKISAHFMPGLYKSSVEKDIQTMEKAYSEKWFKPDEIKFYPTSVIPNTELYNLWKSGKYTPITIEQIKYIVNEIKDRIIPPYTRIKRLIRDIPSTEIAAGTDITNLRQLVLEERKREVKRVIKLAEDKGGCQKMEIQMISEDNMKISEDRKGITDNLGEKSQVIKDSIRLSEYQNHKQYLDKSLKSAMEKWIRFYQKLYEGLQGLGDIRFKEGKVDLDIKKFQKFLDQNVDKDKILTYLLLLDVDEKQVKQFESIIHTNNFWLLDRNFVCMCTRCREIRNKYKGGYLKMDKDIGNQINLIVRKYLSSVGEEYFVSFEDGLGYLYGFIRLLLPQPENTIDWEGVGLETAIVRELHVYGQQTKIGSEGEVQHRGFGSKLMQMAEYIASLKGYQKLSVISGVGVRKYYEKLEYSLKGTYMVKELKKKAIELK